MKMHEPSSVFPDVAFFRERSVAEKWARNRDNEPSRLFGEVCGTI